MGSFFYWHLWTEILCAILALRSPAFWDVTERVLLVSCRRFGTTHRSHLQGSSRTLVVRITILCCVKSQKIAHLTSFPAKPVLFLMEDQHCRTIMPQEAVNNGLTCIQCAEASYSGCCECVFYHT
jgi:hypothetical protein